MNVGLTLREKIELMRQGIIHRYIIPALELRGFLPGTWRRPVSLEDLELRDDTWAPNYSRFTTWETYVREQPLHIYFNTFYGDIYEKAYRHCFIEYIIPWMNYDLNSSLVGVFTRLNLRDGGYVWKSKYMVSISDPDEALSEIEKHYDELLLLLMRAGIAEGGTKTKGRKT
jgi:hypothetical protein